MIIFEYFLVQYTKMDKATAAYFRMNAAKQMKGKKNMSELGNVTDRLLITNVDDKNVGDRL